MKGGKRVAAKSLASATLVFLALNQCGCYSTQSGWLAPSVNRIFAPPPLIPNPLIVPSADYETVWNKTVAVVDKYFDIESENRLARTIRTQPQMGATLLEPWASIR